MWLPCQRTNPPNPQRSALTNSRSSPVPFPAAHLSRGKIRPRSAACIRVLLLSASSKACSSSCFSATPGSGAPPSASCLLGSTFPCLRARHSSFSSSNRVRGEPTAQQQQARRMATHAAATTSAPSPMQQPTQQRGPYEVRSSLTLNPAESALLGTLLEAARASGRGTVLRCAGGWVRDKLLGKDSVDIDVALDNMLGKDFAAVVNEHLECHSKGTRHAADFADLVNEHLKSQGKEARHAAVIQSNPDQSKHLETARLKINDMWIDLVNLRSETYASDSRIPTMEFGTPEQDALRRDFTINSMFYNINEGSVEDLTGKGLDDLRAGIIRTPLHPMETFLDDPLRVLRAVRFATRFGFELEDSLVQAASTQQVCQALGEKVSKERIGAELEGMFNGPAPVDAVRLLSRLGIFGTVFALPSELQRQLPPSSSYSLACGSCMEAAEQLASSLGLTLDKDERRFLLMAALMLPLRKFQVPGAKGKTTPATTHVIRESIKWRAKDAEMTLALQEAALDLQHVQRQLTASGSELAATGDGSAAPDAVKVALGTVIRKLKQHWRLGVCLAPLLAMPSATPLGMEDRAGVHTEAAPTMPAAAGAAVAGTSSSASADEGEMSEAARKLREEQARVLLSAAAAFGLEECWQWKALMDGKQVMALLGMSKPGPELGRAVADVTEWQLAHPDGSVEDCQQFIAVKWGKR